MRLKRIRAMAMKEEADLPIAEELQRQSDRGAAILAVAYLENRLDLALAARLVTDAHTKDSFRKVFKHTGPAGAFGIKAEIAFLLGLCDHAMKEDLVALSDIRNDFAHIARALDFGSPDICGKCAELRTRGIGNASELDSAAARRRFMLAIVVCAARFDSLAGNNGRDGALKISH
jgi:DNA-binding MltR family transcriptional regulator